MADITGSQGQQITEVKIIGPGGVSPTVVVSGDVAVGIADSGNPVKIGGRGRANPALVAENQRVDAWLNLTGALIIGTDYIVGEVFPNAGGGSPRNSGGINTGVPIGAAGFAWTGATWVNVRIPAIFKPLNAVAVNAEATIWTPAAGKKFRLMGYHLTTSVAGNIIIRDNTAGTIIAIVPSGAGGSGVFVSLGNGILSAVANNLLTATGPAASTLSGMVFGIEE